MGLRADGKRVILRKCGKQGLIFYIQKDQQLSSTSKNNNYCLYYYNVDFAQDRTWTFVARLIFIFCLDLYKFGELTFAALK